MIVTKQYICCFKNGVQFTCYKTTIALAGPSDALLTAANLTAGQNFDSGNVCANSVSAFVYIKNDCILPARAVINVSRRAHR